MSHPDARKSNLRGTRAARLIGALAGVVAFAAPLAWPVHAAGDEGPASPGVLATAPADTGDDKPNDNAHLVARGLDAAAATRPANGGAAAAASRITLKVNQTRLVNTLVPIVDVIGPEQDVVWVRGIGPTELSLTARKPGAVQIQILDEQHRSQTIDVVVEADLETLRAELARSLPALRIDVSEANGIIVMRGHVPNAEVAETAAKIAAPFGKLMNLLEISGGQQVTLHVRFAEVSRDAITALGVNFGIAGANNQFGASVIGGVQSFGIAPSQVRPDALVLGVPSPGSNVTAFGQFVAGATPFDVFLTAMRQNNLMRTLAEPNLTVLSGSQASFLAGGQFPYPVPQSGGAGGGSTTITIDYKEYGVRLNFSPVVLGDGRIRLHVQPEVSDLDYAHAITLQGFTVPGLTTRTADTTVELAEGQTLSLAGLLDSRVTANNTATPLLGEIPILGALFRSVRYERTETELVVLVTPTLAGPMNPAAVPATPGRDWRFPSDAQIYVNGDLGGPASDVAHAPRAVPPPTFQGTYGFVPATPPAGQQQ